MKVNQMNKTWILLLAFGVSVSAQAAVYECTDASGRKIYTQSPGKNCSSSNLGKPSVYTSAPVAVANESASAGIEVQPSAAASGDASAERRALAQAQKALAEGKAVRLANERNYAKYLERVQGLEKQVKAAEQKLRAAEQGALNGNGSTDLGEAGLR